MDARRRRVIPIPSAILNLDPQDLADIFARNKLFFGAGPLKTSLSLMGISVEPAFGARFRIRSGKASLSLREIFDEDD
jgi:hypothetical protein